MIRMQANLYSPSIFTSNNEGSVDEKMPRRGENIYKRKDGRWEGRILKPDGKYKYVYANSYKEVKEKKSKYQEFVKNQVIKHPTQSSQASSLFERWLEGSVTERVKPSTYESYYRCIKLYVIPYFESTKENRITALTAAQFGKYVYQNKLLSAAYKKKIITVFKVALKDILKDSDDNEQILRAVKVPRQNVPLIEVFPLSEQRLIEAEALKMNDDRVIGVFLCFYTGIRLGELCALKWENIDLETQTMTVVKTVYRTKNFKKNESKTKLLAGTPKSSHSIREIPLPDFLVGLMKNMKKTRNDEDYILSGTDTPIDPRTFQKLFKKVLNKAGVKNRKFHTIRHTFATRALEAGVDIKTLSEILGHSSVLITLKVYTHSLMEQKIAAIGKMNNLFVAPIDVEPFAVATAPSDRPKVPEISL